MRHLTCLILAFLLILVGGCRSPETITLVPSLMGLSATGDALADPPVADDLDPHPDKVAVELTASDADVQLVDGRKTRMMVFNGSFPAPTIICKEGDEVRVHVKNLRDEPLTVHFHGLIIPTEQDGAPYHEIPVGEEHTYIWTARRNHAMTAWYHSHTHGITHIQAPRGLAGMIKVLGPSDAKLDGFGDTSLLLTDPKLDSTNQFPPDTEFDRFEGREGNLVLVNGQRLPKLVLRPGEWRRLRIANVGGARTYKLHFPGMRVLQIGSDGGLFKTPIDRTGKPMVMAMAERIELLVQAPHEEGAVLTMQSLRYDRGLGLRENFTRTLMTFEVQGASISQPPVPSVLRVISPISLQGAQHREVELDKVSVGNGMQHFVINEKRFSPIRIDNVSRQGVTEVITIRNKSGNWDHPMHLHSVQFQVIDIDGVPFDPMNNPSWKDVVNVPRNSVARLVVRYDQTEYPGLFMFHCHILQHEDDGMMTHIMINPAGTP